MTSARTAKAARTVTAMTVALGPLETWTTCVGTGAEVCDDDGAFAVEWGEVPSRQEASSVSPTTFKSELPPDCPSASNKRNEIDVPAATFACCHTKLVEPGSGCNSNHSPSGINPCEACRSGISKHSILINTHNDSNGRNGSVIVAESV